MIDIDKLEALADAATEGPWFVRGRPTDDGLAVIEDGRQAGLFDITCEFQEAQFIAATDPTAVKELIARIRELEEALLALLNDVDDFELDLEIPEPENPDEESSVERARAALKEKDSDH